jgi:hypothetical protein
MGSILVQMVDGARDSALRVQIPVFFSWFQHKPVLFNNGIMAMNRRVRVVGVISMFANFAILLQRAGL